MLCARTVPKRFAGPLCHLTTTTQVFRAHVFVIIIPPTHRQSQGLFHLFGSQFLSLRYDFTYWITRLLKVFRRISRVLEVSAAGITELSSADACSQDLVSSWSNLR